VVSRKLTKSIAAGVAAIAIAGGSYGIVSATSSGSPAAASSGTAGSGGAAGGPGSGGGSNARSGPAAGGVIGHGQRCVHVGLHADNSSGSEGDR
jgi:hypothetical protein